MKLFKRIGRTWRPVLLFLTIATTAGVGSAIVEGRPEFAPRTALALTGAVVGVLAGLYVCLLISVAIHELGHVVAGLVVGMRFRSVSVFGFGLRKDSEGIHPFFSSALMNGGMAVMDLTDTNRYSHQYRVHVLGGPIATILLLATTIYGTIEVFPLTSRNPELFWLGLALLLMAGTNLAFAYSCLVPRTVQGMATDALLLIQLRQMGNDSDRFAALMQIMNQIREGVRAKDWNSEMLEAAGASRDGAFSEGSARYVRYYNFLDTGRAEEAYREIERGRGHPKFGG